MSAEKIYNIEQARASLASRLVIEVDAALASNGFVDELKKILEPVTGGNCPIYVNYRSPQAQVEIALGEEWKISPTDSMLERLSGLTGADNVQVVYP